MLRNIIVLGDGRELSSGAPGAAIRSVRLLQTVAGSRELEPGAVCAAMLEVSVMDAQELTVTAGEKMTLYKADEAGNRYPVGVFTAEKPLRTSKGCFTVTAYDNIAALDRDLTDWLAGLTGWPYSVWELAQMVCGQCGVALQEMQLPGGSYSVSKITPGQVTGRQLMQWIAQALGRFCRANEQGAVEFGWYEASDLSLGPETIPELTAQLEGKTLRLDGEHITAMVRDDTLILEGVDLEAAVQGENLTLSQGGQSHIWYRQGSLQLADYAAQPVERVCIRATAEDVGAVWPNHEGQKNTYTVTGNPLLQAMGQEQRLALAQNLYELLSTVSYIPCSVKIPAQPMLKPGTIVKLWTDTGACLPLYIMTREQTGQTELLSATGSPSRESTTAVNQVQRQLAGKVLELTMDVQGLRAENRQDQEKSAALELTVEAITAQVRQQQVQAGHLEQQMSSLQQTAQGLSLELQTVRQEGVSAVTTSTGYRFGADGLQICKTGEQMENLLDHTGMYVRRSSEVILQATGDGVEATDVAVRNYLMVGDHARLEDYANSTDPHRTACFYIT